MLLCHMCLNMLLQGDQAPACEQPATDATVAAAQQMQDLSVHPGDECEPLLETQHGLQ